MTRSADDDTMDVLLDPAEELRCTLGGELTFFGSHVWASLGRELVR